MSATEWKKLASPWWIKLLDYFFLMRPVLFLPGWITLIAGYCIARGDNTLLQDVIQGRWQIESGTGMLFLGLGLFSAAMGGSFIFNQIYDVDSDRKNNKLFLLGDGIISLSAGKLWGILLIFISLVGAVYIHPRFIVIIAIFNLITAYMYNAWPFHLKSRPIGGLLANMAMGLLAFWAGWALVQPINKTAFLFAVPYLLFNTGLYLFTTLPDVNGDATTGKITFPVRFGVQPTIWWGVVLIIMSGVAAIALREEILQLILVLILPSVVKLGRNMSIQWAIILLKRSILIFAIVISAKFPWLFGIGGALYVISRYYYRIRFNMEYPTMKSQ